MVGTFHIVLKQEEGFDVHDTREFDLALDSKFAIGRASKNQAKGYLLPGKHNVFIDSPVVSREHAIFTAKASSGVPQVFITDTKSMHGTYVNGALLVPHTPKLLCNGDGLQFGVNVNRNENYFMAYKYTFRAELSNFEPFSRGFTVPEAESEEEMDIMPSGRGSQLDPLVLDDSDAEADPGLEKQGKDAEHSEDNVDLTMAYLEEEEVVIDDFAEDQDAADSDADDMSSDVESEDRSTGSALEHDLESPLIDDAQHVEDINVQVEVPATQVELMPLEYALPSSGQSADAALPKSKQSLMDPVSTDYGPAIASFAQPPQNCSPWLTGEEPSFEDTPAPPLPPRPSQKRQKIWDEAPQQEQTWYREPLITLDQSAFFHQNFPAAETEPTLASLPAADRFQTPPHAEPADAAPTHSARETDTAVTEVVDVQPPTPTSINSRKRSADEAFEEKAEEPAKNVIDDSETMAMVPAHPILTVDAEEDVAVPTVEEATARSQRPVAQPKGIFSRALSAAKVMVPATALGAVFTVTALTTLPESFFTVA